MKIQNLQNYNRHGIGFPFKLGLIIIFMTLVCMTGCEKINENSGKLVVNGQTYFLDEFEYWYEINEVGLYVSDLTFRSSIDGTSVSIYLYNQYSWYGDLPTGTFKMDGNKKQIIASIRMSYGSSNGLLVGSWSDSRNATLKITKSGNAHNFTLNGDLGENVKLTYKFHH
ncbi:MAG: hypothetical protein FWC34_06915 [Bacteroidetes bacterium]|nr:hypothetical protein [Bacteroidota bacterium]MCL2302889.1 hypothetical protein [Lentimicrobiaceae bacterium]